MMYPSCVGSCALLLLVVARDSSCLDQTDEGWCPNPSDVTVVDREGWCLNLSDVMVVDRED